MKALALTHCLTIYIDPSDLDSGSCAFFSTLPDRFRRFISLWRRLSDSSQRTVEQLAPPDYSTVHGDREPTLKRKRQDSSDSLYQPAEKRILAIVAQLSQRVVKLESRACRFDSVEREMIDMRFKEAEQQIANRPVSYNHEYEYISEMMAEEAMQRNRDARDSDEEAARIQVTMDELHQKGELLQAQIEEMRREALVISEKVAEAHQEAKDLRCELGHVDIKVDELEQDIREFRAETEKEGSIKVTRKNQVGPQERMMETLQKIARMTSGLLQEVADMRQQMQQQNRQQIRQEILQEMEELIKVMRRAA